MCYDEKTTGLSIKKYLIRLSVISSNDYYYYKVKSADDQISSFNSLTRDTISFQNIKVYVGLGLVSLQVSHFFNYYYTLPITTPRLATIIVTVASKSLLRHLVLNFY